MIFLTHYHLICALFMKTKIYRKATSFVIAYFAMLCFAQAQDWPNLQRYQADNAKLKALPVPKDRVVFLGNSITDFWINNSPEFFESNHYIDRGISGQTSPQMLLRFRQDVIDLHPKAVVIECGTNDIAGNTGPSTVIMIEDNIKSMAELAKANKIKVLLGSVLPSNRFSWAPKVQPADSIIKLNVWIKQYCKANNFIYVDYYTALVDDAKGLKKGYGPDGVHPNKEGYAVMEGIVSAALKKPVKK